MFLIRCKHTITPVILSGGSGTRLWPLSRKSLPKQFVPIIGEKSLYQLTLERCSRFGGDVMTLASTDHKFLVTEAMEKASASGCVILEPVGRNTAAAMALAALHNIEKGGGDDLLLFCPADHYVPDAEGFVETVRLGAEAAKSGAIVIYGVVPSFPSTAYGYIKGGAQRADGGIEVVKFIKKPQEQVAQALLLEGGVLWNAGVFLATSNVIIAALEKHAVGVLNACKAAMAQPRQLEDDDGKIMIEPGGRGF